MIKLILLIPLLLKLFCEDFQTIEIKPGQTLWDISQIYLKDPKKWDEIVKYNNLSPDPYQPITGKKIKIPVRLIKEEYIEANFSKIVGEVKVRAREKSSWHDATKVKSLYKGDTVRTNANSYAEVIFYTRQTLNIFSNSMVVIKPPTDKFDLKILSGQIKAKGTSIITVSAKITPTTKDTELAAKIKEDLSTVVQVYKGEAKVEAKGKSVSVKEGFSTEVKLNSIPKTPEKITDVLKEQKLASIDADVKKNIISLKYQNTRNENIKIDNPVKAKELKLKNFVNIDLNKAISGYRVQIAMDIDFKNVVLDRRFDVFENLNFSNYIPKGKYYFRISYIDLIGFEGEFSKPKEITIE